MQGTKTDSTFFTLATLATFSTLATFATLATLATGTCSPNTGTYVAVSPAFVVRPAPNVVVHRPTSGTTLANGATTSIQYAKLGAVGAVTIDLLRGNGLVLVSGSGNGSGCEV